MPTFNWEGYKTHKILTGSGIVLVTVLGYTLTPFGTFVVAPWTMTKDVADIKTYITEHESYVKGRISSIREEAEKQDQKIEQLLKYHQRDFEVVGTGSVGNFGGDEAYVRVNRRSKAGVYKDGDTLRVTCDIEGKPKATLIVKGTFSNSDQDLIISFSKEAAEDLGITARVGVEIEPVIEQ